MDALIGHTGFVGGNLCRQRDFGALFNSRNIDNIRGQAFDLLVCAGAPGTKWRANQQPDEDRMSVARLIGCLEAVRAKRMLLISTIDVYPAARAVDEDTPIEIDSLTPYGAHRRELELFAASRFQTTTLRLPGLFGPGLKKNAVFDMLHGSFSRVPCEGHMQFYDLANLWEDAQHAIRSTLKYLNLATEPVDMRDVAQCLDCGPQLRRDGRSDPPFPDYDMRTRHASLRGCAGHYLYSANAVLDQLRQMKIISVSELGERAQ